MKTITEANELAYFLWSMLSGALMAVVYDFLRARRREKKVSALFVCIEDILCAAFLGALAYVLAFHENAGMVRWYSLLGIGLGGLFLKLLLGDRLMNLFRKVYSLFVRAFCFFIKILLLPVRLAAKLVRRPISVVVWHSREGSKQISDILKVLKIRISNRLRK